MREGSPFSARMNNVWKYESSETTPIVYCTRVHERWWFSLPSLVKRHAQANKFIRPDVEKLCLVDSCLSDSHLHSIQRMTPLRFSINLLLFWLSANSVRGSKPVMCQCCLKFWTHCCLWASQLPSQNTWFSNKRNNLYSGSFIFHKGPVMDGLRRHSPISLKKTVLIKKEIWYRIVKKETSRQRTREGSRCLVMIKQVV